MRSIFTTLLVAATALVWLLFVTLAPEATRWADLLRQCALFLTAVSAARLVAMLLAALIGDRRTRHATDLVRAITSVVIYIGALIAWLSFGLHFDVTSLLATSAVVTVVLGFALQATLGNLFAGLSLELERPIRVGDYLRKPPHEGTVVALKWRSIFLRSSNGSLVVLPNSALAASPVEMIPRDAPVRHMATFHVPAFYPPMRVLEAIREALADDLHPGILSDPAPSAVMVGTEHQSASILYGARFYTNQPIDLSTHSSAVLSRIWYLLHRAGIAMTGRVGESQTDPAREAPFAIAPPSVPRILIEAGSPLWFGSGERLPPDFAGVILEGSLHEQYVEQEFDHEAAVRAVTDAAEEAAGATSRPGGSARAAIAREATTFLGPVAATLVDRFARRTGDPYLIYHALATRIPSANDRDLFLASAPSRPVRRLLTGDCFGWRGLLGLEDATARARVVPTSAHVLVFSRAQLKALLAEEAGEALVTLLGGSQALAGLGPQALRHHLDALVA